MKRLFLFLIILLLSVSVSACANYGINTDNEGNNDGNTEQTDQNQGDQNEQPSDKVIYQNTQYGFDFTLPVSWKGYTIVTDKWEGYTPDDTEGQKLVTSGPLISIRHPEWTKETPRQDIPIMVFTLSQWESLQKDEFHIGAAPIGPSELGRNSKYVFALPARYNYAFPAGYEEVEQILSSNALQPTENISE